MKSTPMMRMAKQPKAMRKSLPSIKPRLIHMSPAACRLALCLGGLLVSAACHTGVPHSPAKMGEKELDQHVAQRFALILCLPEGDARKLLTHSRVTSESGLSLSSATPVSADGFFLTNAHSVKQMQEGYACTIFYSPGKDARKGLARLWWVDEGADLALLKAPFETPHFYQWTPLGSWLAERTPVRHGGASTGPMGQVGALLQSVPGRGGRRPLRHSLRLQPGDSGGPLVALSGELVAVNQAVGYMGVMDTQFFTESRAVRPDPAKLAELMRRGSP